MLVKSCPFCGGKPYIESSSRGYINGEPTKTAYVRCRNCNARSERVNLKDYNVSSFSMNAVEDVVKAWNRRVSSVKEFDVSEHHSSKSTKGE